MVPGIRDSQERFFLINVKPAHPASGGKSRQNDRRLTGNMREGHATIRSRTKRHSALRPSGRSSAKHQRHSSASPTGPVAPAGDSRAPLERMLRNGARPRVGRAGWHCPAPEPYICPTVSPGGPPEAFIDLHEFCHLHPLPEGTIHLVLPLPVVGRAALSGWVQRHPLTLAGILTTLVMVYAPRNFVQTGNSPRTDWDIAPVCERS
jgi:hypothetical protein